MKKIRLSVAAALLFAVAFSTSSCKKEDLSNNSLPGNEQAVPSARKFNPLVFQPGASMYGASYGIWSGRWWKWAMELPPVSNHPFFDSPNFDVTMGQSGDVWYLAGVLPGTVTRDITIPTNKALFVALLNAEASDLEGYGNTYTELLAGAKAQADLIANVVLNIDGMDVPNINSYRVVSPAPPVSFTAPSPWIFGATGGPGILVADGYFAMVKPLSEGNHVLHFSGAVPSYGLTLDMTYNITVK